MVHADLPSSVITVEMSTPADGRPAGPFQLELPPAYESLLLPAAASAGDQPLPDAEQTRITVPRTIGGVTLGDGFDAAYSDGTVTAPAYGPFVVEDAALLATGSAVTSPPSRG